MANEYQHPSLINLVPEFEDKFDLVELGVQIAEEYERDRQARADWEDMHAQWVRLYYQKDKPVSKRRWSGSSDESLPVLTEAVHQHHTRLYQAMFANRQLLTVNPVGRPSREDRERGKRIEYHMSWQITAQDLSYKRNKDKLLLSLGLNGCVFSKAYRDYGLGRNVVKNVRAIDLVVPYGVGPRTIAELSHKTETIWMTVNDTRVLTQLGYLSEEAMTTEYVMDHLHAPEIAVQEALGQHEPAGEREENKPVLLLESHRMVDFDGDGIAEPYIVTVDAQSKKILRISIRWETDELGNPTDEKAPIELYTPWHFYENPDGFYGLGLGHLLGEPNKAVNRMLRQIIDAGTLATQGNASGFVNKSAIGAGGGELEIEMGKFRSIGGNAEDVRKAVYQFQFPGPNAALLQALTLVLQRSDRLGLNTEAVTGQLDRALQPTTVLALLEQSTQSFGAVIERVAHAWSDELGLLYRLNRQFLDPVEYFQVEDIDGNILDQEITREDYAADMEVMPMLDVKSASEKERIQRAEMEYNLLINEPLVNMSPIHRYNVVRDFARALGIDNLDEKLPNPLMMDPLQQQMLMMNMMQQAGRDESGLQDGQTPMGADQGLAGGPGDAMGSLGGGGIIPGGPLDNGSANGGAPPSGAGAGETVR